MIDVINKYGNAEGVRVEIAIPSSPPRVSVIDVKSCVIRGKSADSIASRLLLFAFEPFGGFHSKDPTFVRTLVYGEMQPFAFDAWLCDDLRSMTVSLEQCNAER